MPGRIDLKEKDSCQASSYSDVKRTQTTISKYSKQPNGSNSLDHMIILCGVGTLIHECIHVFPSPPLPVTIFGADSNSFRSQELDKAEPELVLQIMGFVLKNDRSSRAYEDKSVRVCNVAVVRPTTRRGGYTT
jgi:hypothetical protein